MSGGLVWQENVSLNLIFRPSRSRHCPESDRFAEGPNKHGGADTGGSGSLSGMSEYVILERQKNYNLISKIK